MKTREKAKLTERIHFRCTQKEKNRIKGLASLYAGGNLSLWIAHAALNCDRRFLKPDDLHDSTRKKKKLARK